MFMIFTFIIPLTSIYSADIDAAQFSRLMAGLHSEIGDVALVFEGDARVIPRGKSVDDVLSGIAGANLIVAYQGSYAYRSDGATLLDKFNTHYGTAKDRSQTWSTHTSVSILDFEKTKLSRFPNQRGERPTTEPGGAGSLNDVGSPERILYFWFFKAFEKFGPDGWGYEFQGWENVNGRRCLRVQFDEGIGLSDRPPDRPVIRFWIDMERGGHPLKVEFADGKGVRMRSVDIELAELTVPDGTRIWFPARGRTESFVTTDGYSKTPNVVESYHVLNGTVRFNQNLPDRQFSVDWQGGMPETPTLARLRRDFRQPVPRMDPEAVRERLKTQLELADAQAKQLEASSPARQSWNLTTVLQLLFGTLGIILLVWAIMIRRQY